jgi:flagellum-specific ATP synthase
VSAADLNTARGPVWTSRLERRIRKVERTPAPAVEGSLTRMIGLTLEAVGCQASIGDTCDVITGDGSRVESEVVGFAGERLYLMPTGDAH